MGFGVHRESTAVPVYHGDDGYGYAGISGGSGTVALSAGGIPVLREYNSNDFTTDPLDVPVIVRPSTSDPSYMEIGVRVPDGAVIGIANRWVVYWEED